MEQLLYSVRDAGRQLGLGETKTRDLIRQGRLRAVVVDGTTRVPRDAIIDFVRALPTSEVESPDEALVIVAAASRPFADEHTTSQA